MTKFILVRHGEPTYDEVGKLGFKGHGIALAPLTKNGISEVEKTAENEIFRNSDILISSPYTRTMQTASIIANKYNLRVNVEVLLHEWIPDLTHNYNTVEEFTTNIRIAKNDWQQSLINPNYVLSDKVESLESVRKRGLSVLERYCDYDKVIVVTHGLLISMLFNEKVRLHTGDFIVTNSEELEKQFDFHPIKIKK